MIFDDRQQGNMTPMITTKNISYEIIEENIHQFILHSNTRQTVDDLFAQTTIINMSARPDEKMLYLFDSNNISDLPFRYVIQLAEKWRKEQDYIPPARNAIMYGTNSLMRYMVNVLVDISKKSDAESRIFHPDNRDEAIAWLQLHS